MELKVITSSKKASSLQVADDVFAQPFNESLMHQVVTAYRNAQRAGTKAQKTRAEVRGGGIKPWRQKGTGRARAGTIRSPLWRKGGVTFAAKPRCFAQKVNKSMLKGALRSILSELVKQERLIVVDNLTMNTPKTKDLLTHLKTFDVKDVLIVTENTEQKEKNLYLASRNLAQVEVCQAKKISPVDLIAFEKVLVTAPAIKQIEEWLA